MNGLSFPLDIVELQYLDMNWLLGKNRISTFCVAPRCSSIDLPPVSFRVVLLTSRTKLTLLCTLHNELFTRRFVIDCCYYCGGEVCAQIGIRTCNSRGRAALNTFHHSALLRCWSFFNKWFLEQPIKINFTEPDGYKRDTDWLLRLLHLWSFNFLDRIQLAY